MLECIFKLTKTRDTLSNERLRDHHDSKTVIAMSDCILCPHTKKFLIWVFGMGSRDLVVSRLPLNSMSLVSSFLLCGLIFEVQV